jgi:hypothetical protein
MQTEITARDALDVAQSISYTRTIRQEAISKSLVLPRTCDGRLDVLPARPLVIISKQYREGVEERL